MYCELRVKMSRKWNKSSVLCWLWSVQRSLLHQHKTHFQTSPTDAFASGNTAHAIQTFDAIPGPKGLPFVGSVWEYMGKDGIEKMFKVHQELFKKHGPIFKENLFGRTIVNVMEPIEYEKVFRADGKYPHRSIVEAWLLYRQRRNHCPGLVLAQGEEWHRYRQAVAPKLLRPAEAAKYTDNLNSVVKDAVARIHSARDSAGEVPDLEYELVRWSTESIGTVVFDTRLGLYEEDQQEQPARFIRAVDDFFTFSQKLELGPQRFFMHYVDTPDWKKFCHAHDTAMTIGQAYVNKQLQELKEMGDEQGIEYRKKKVVPVLVHILANEGLTPREINMIAIELCMAGVHTSANTMLWLLYNLACNPEVQQSLHEEVSDVLGTHGYVTDKELPRMPLVKACLKETLRLFPVSFLIPRVLQQDVELCGYNLPKGTDVHISVYTAGRSEMLFDEPLLYKPERWLRDNRNNINHFASLPFGFGQRMCVGRRIAENKTYLFLAKIIQRFRLEFHHEPIEAKLKLLLVPDRPVRIKFVSRT